MVEKPVLLNCPRKDLRETPVLRMVTEDCQDNHNDEPVPNNCCEESPTKAFTDDESQ